MVYKINNEEFQVWVLERAGWHELREGYSVLEDHPELEDPALYDLALDDAMTEALELGDRELEHRPAYVSTDLALTVVEYLLAYIYVAFQAVAPGYLLMPRDVAGILHDVYGFGIEAPADGHVLMDADDIWYGIAELTDHGAILAISMFDREGLYRELEVKARAIAGKSGDAVLEYVLGEGGRFAGFDGPRYGPFDELLSQPFGQESGSGKAMGWPGWGTRWAEVRGKPAVVPDPGYEVDGWYLENGTRLEDDTRIMDDHRITVRFRKVLERVSV